ncbi:thiamine-phosphate kinase [Halarchaeum nitratireducens]|uniref:Thiamine-monophosphate kinase n=1 Tax=Halarchaeum nitratireducens TaxID=489913 RepID=A0A830G7Q2_9EURY|nr:MULTISPECIES: thiamine-phosphate kinase [Halarchaeum]MBP2251210.1 thiamine-monophosphate kinase [Halarchaeum solikamskense]GGN06715.1 thiamine-monophosphate kinase [Halarchaeum nitratireducens]
MDERVALGLVDDLVDAAGDDAAVLGETVVTIDMLHETTDFPAGTTRYTAGWRAVGASLSDVAAMGASATGAVGVYGAPSFDTDDVEAFVRGALDVCERVSAEYVGGDLDGHDEFTVATAALGETPTPVSRDGASGGEVVAVTGALGRSAAALDAFEAGDTERANELFRFTPRVGAGVALNGRASAMMDSSDGLARSLHQLSETSGVGFDVEGAAIPIHDALRGEDRLARATTFGEDFELVCTLPSEGVAPARAALDVPLTVVGDVTEAGVTMDGEALADRGYTHGE